MVQNILSLCPQLHGRSSGSRLFGLIAGCWLLASSPAVACTIPVFCYALEHWAADPYQVLVFHQGSLAEKGQALAASLVERSSRPDFAANCVFETIDVSAPLEAKGREIWENLSAPEVPWMVVRSPLGSCIWEGPLNPVEVERILDSPGRRELARRLLSGDAGVWILLESGNEEEDTRAALVLDAAMSRGDPSSASEKEAGIREDHSEFRFSLMRLSRKAPEEHLLVQMLLHSEEDLGTSPKAMAFPVFGRGRVLYALVGRGINAANIREACSFISGECSCQIKELNPGTDLLMSVDWPGQFNGQRVALGDSAVAGGASTQGRESGGNTGGGGVFETLRKTSLGRNLLLVLLAGLGVIGITAGILARRT